MSSYIYRDVWLQILKRLPVKTLLRFQCVCKWMKETIGENSLMLDHLSRQNPAFLVQSDTAAHERTFFVLDPNSLPLIVPVTNPFGRSWILGTLHGVVCLYDDTIGLRLWNPSTHQSFVPPRPRIANFTCSSNRHYYYVCAFWINRSTRDFKVIVCHSPDMGVRMKAVLYNSVEGRWTVIPAGGWIKTFCFFHCGNFANPALMIGAMAYWMFTSVKVPGIRPLVPVVLSFDFVMERFDFIDVPLPARQVRGTGIPQHFRWQGELSILHPNTLRMPECFRMPECSIFLKPTASWNQVYSYPLPFLAEHVFWVTGTSEQGGKVIALDPEEDHLVLVDPSDGTIPLNEVNWETRRPLMVYDYVESLMFPNH